MEPVYFTVVLLSDVSPGYGYTQASMDGLNRDMAREEIDSWMHDDGGCIGSHAVEVWATMGYRMRRLPRWVRCN